MRRTRVGTRGARGRAGRGGGRSRAGRRGGGRVGSGDRRSRLGGGGVVVPQQVGVMQAQGRGQTAILQSLQGGAKRDGWGYPPRRSSPVPKVFEPTQHGYVLTKKTEAWT